MIAISLVLGRFQVGKSTLINSLFYEKGKKYVKYAEEGDAKKATTTDVKPYPIDYHGVVCHVYDSPGLQDGQTADVHYLMKIKRECPDIHLIIYCTKMNEPIRPDEDKALHNLRYTF